NQAGRLQEFVTASLDETTTGIFVIKHEATSHLDDVGIVLEAAAMLFGLMVVMNLNYPPELKFTFEVLQKVVMELDGSMLSKEAQVLNNRLYQ
uniref:Uncharacterized protein n=1 Tax=Stegastes partitus TaxID=144197 RepID=A0A3B4ZRI5_9TELE